jgi:hypothetical protein
MPREILGISEDGQLNTRKRLGRPSDREYLTRGDKQERMLRILLSKVSNNRTWYSIAKEAESSYGSAHRFLTDLSESGFIDGSKVVDARGLFKYWAMRRDKRLFREYHIRNPEAVLRDVRFDYALTGYFGENLIGGYLFPRFREFYVMAGDAAKWDSLLLANGMAGHGNVKVILADDHVFYERQMVKGWPLVSIQQLIVDLMRTGAECAEAADLLIGREYLDRATIR